MRNFEHLTRLALLLLLCISSMDTSWAQISTFNLQHDLPLQENTADIIELNSSYLLFGVDNEDGRNELVIEMTKQGRFIREAELADSTIAWEIYRVLADEKYLYCFGNKTYYDERDSFQVNTTFTKYDYRDSVLVTETIIGTPDSAEKFRDVTWMENGNIALSGFRQYLNPWSAPPADLRLSIISDMGETLFDKTYLHPYRDEGNTMGAGIVETSDGDLIQVGWRNHDKSFFTLHDLKTRLHQAILMRVDSLGNLEKRRFYPSRSRDASIILADVIQVNDSSFIACGKYEDINHIDSLGVFFPDSTSYYAIGFDEELEILWETKVDTFAYAFWHRIAPGHHGHYILTGERWNTRSSQDSLPPGIFHNMASLTSMNSKGKILWHRFYTGSHLNYHDTNKFEGTPLATSDGGYIATGYAHTTTGRPYNQNSWVLKVDSLGCVVPGCDEDIITDVEELDHEPSEITAFPNPTTDQLTIELTRAEPILGYKLLTASGSVVMDMQFTDPQSDYQLQMDLSSYPQGLYRVALRLQSGWRVVNVVKM